MEDAAWWLTGRLDAQLAFLDSLGLAAKCYLGLPGATQSRLGPPILIIHQDTPPQTSLIQIIPQLKPLPLVILACDKLTFKTNHPICSETESLNHEVILFFNSLRDHHSVFYDGWTSSQSHPQRKSSGSSASFTKHLYHLQQEGFHAPGTCIVDGSHFSPELIMVHLMPSTQPLGGRDLVCLIPTGVWHSVIPWEGSEDDIKVHGLWPRYVKQAPPHLSPYSPW